MLRWFKWASLQKKEGCSHTCCRGCHWSAACLMNNAYVALTHWDSQTQQVSLHQHLTFSAWHVFHLHLPPVHIVFLTFSERLTRWHSEQKGVTVTTGKGGHVTLEQQWGHKDPLFFISKLPGSTQPFSRLNTIFTVPDAHVFMYVLWEHELLNMHSASWPGPQIQHVHVIKSIQGHLKVVNLVCKIIKQNSKLPFSSIFKIINLWNWSNIFQSREHIHKWNLTQRHHQDLQEVCESS